MEKPVAGEPWLDADHAGALARQAAAMGCGRAVLTGGEPLLRPDLEEVLARVQAGGLGITLLTNGLALERHAAAVARHCDAVIVSLDAWDARSYREVRGVDGWAALGRGVAALGVQAPGLPVTARVTVSGLNAGHLLAIGQAAQGLGLRGISLLAADGDSTGAFARQAPAGLPPVDVTVLREQLELLRDRVPLGFLLDSAAALDRLVRLCSGVRGPPRCDAPWTSVVVGQDLTLKPCYFLPVAASASAGLLAGLDRAAPALAAIDVSTNPTCARCVCWGRFT